MSRQEGPFNNNNNNEQLQQSQATANGHRPDPNQETAMTTTTSGHHHHHHHHHEATSGPHKEGEVASYHFECMTPWLEVRTDFTFNGWGRRHAAASNDEDEDNSNDNGYSLRKLSRKEKKQRRALLGIKWYHRLELVLFRSWMRKTTPQILFVQNLHPTKTAHVILLTPQSKESMESFFRVAVSLPIPSASPAGGELDSHQVYQLLEASDQFKEVQANNGAIFHVDPNGSGWTNGNHYVHAAVLFRADAEDDNDEDKAEDDTNDTFVYCLSQLADVNPQRNALVVQPTSLENGTTPKPKVTVTMEQTGKWTIRTYHGAATK